VYSYQISKIFRFEAAHRLPDHDGQCARPHGHSYVLTIHIACNQLIERGPQRGMVIDFAHLVALVKPLLESHLDHYDLNVSTGLENPTSEHLARWIYDRIVPGIRRMRPDTELAIEVELSETCTSSCRYRGPTAVQPEVQR
jgi:6-pyruvoyltetrahydropterin/6-carboxytetrahydropterin synthase